MTTSPRSTFTILKSRPPRTANGCRESKPAATGQDDRRVLQTYQSIKPSLRPDEHGLPEFDLIICDEAHRTTGATLEGEEESNFVKVHDADYIKARSAST